MSITIAVVIVVSTITGLMFACRGAAKSDPNWGPPGWE